jgi:hypothetical protein
MKRRIYRRGLLAILLVGLALLPQEARGGRRDHEGGFFVRLSAGGGWAWTRLDILGLRTQFSGLSRDVNVALGVMAARNLAVHATVFGWALSEPKMLVGPVDLGRVEADLTLPAAGAGMTYYLMPANIYLSGSVGAGKLTLDYAVSDFESHYVVVVDATAGKEWWVSGDWALGVAAGFGLYSIPGEDTRDDWSGPSVSLRVTATVN